MQMWEVLAVLQDPKRRSLLELVRDAGQPLTRDELAERSGLPRPTVAFHLDRLSEAGFVEVDFARAPGRTGPGAGRPAKRYRMAQGEVTASFPERRYDVVAAILADAVNEMTSPEAESLTAKAARRRGAEAAAGFTGGRGDARKRSRRSVVEALDDLGYHPSTVGRGGVALRNCPFHAVSSGVPEVACPINREFVQGFLDEFTGGRARAVLEGKAGSCCVSVHWTSGATVAQ